MIENLRDYRNYITKINFDAIERKTKQVNYFFFAFLLRISYIIFLLKAYISTTAAPQFEKAIMFELHSSLNLELQIYIKIEEAALLITLTPPHKIKQQITRYFRTSQSVKSQKHVRTFFNELSLFVAFSMR